MSDAAAEVVEVAVVPPVPAEEPFHHHHRETLEDINARIKAKLGVDLMLEASLVECLTMTRPSVLNRAFAVWVKCDEAFLLRR